MPIKKTTLPKENTEFLKVVKNVPVPEKSNKGRKIVYPFQRMEIGDSFLIPHHLKNKINSSMRQFGIKNPEYRFIMRKEGENIRVWRVDLDSNKNI